MYMIGFWFLENKLILRLVLFLYDPEPLVNVNIFIKVYALTMTNRIKIPSMKRVYSLTFPLYIYTPVVFCEVIMLYFSDYSTYPQQCL